MKQQTIRTFITILLATLFFKNAFSQAVPGIISGAVKDAGNESLAGATVRLLKADDSTLIKTEATNNKGKFQFSGLMNGAYLLAVTAAGQRPYTSVELTIDEKHNSIVMPVIALLPSKSNVLAEVVVKAKRPLMVHEIDKTIVHVEAMISSATSNTLEVLERTPGVSVSASGEISLNGKAGVLVLIDGRSTYMSGQDLAAYLKSLPGGLLDKLELMDNPPAKYDAAGGSIINIRLKKNRAGGLTGSFSTGYTQGRYGRNNDAVNLNYNRKKLNLFANFGYNNEKNYTTDVYDRRFYTATAQPSSSVALVNNQRYTSRGVNMNAGLDYAANSKTTYGVNVNVNQGYRNGRLDYASDNFNASHELAAIGKGNTVGSDTRKNLGANVNLLHRFNNTGRELTADVNYLNYHSWGRQALQNYFYQPDGAQTGDNEFLYLLPADVTIYAAKADYTHPLNNKAKIDAGFKSSVVDNDNIADYYDVEGSAKTIDNDKSNHFRYRENINAGYINVQKAGKRVSAQFGLRIENTYARGHQLGNDATPSSSFTKSYTRLFPGAYLNYKLDSLGRNSLNLSVTRRINRPNYQSLNPFLFFRDQYSYTSGNPMLGPQYQTRVELKYQRNQFLNMGLSYNKFTHVIFQTTQAIDNIFITRPDNIASGFMLLLNTSVSFSPVTWWHLNTTLRLSHMGINGQVYTEKLNPRANVARLEINNYFSIGKNWNAEAGGYYASSDLNGQSKTSGMFRVQAAVQKKVWKDKGSIRFSLDDIFHSWIYHNRSVSLKQAEYFQTNETDTRRIGLAFTYRFGKDSFTRKRKHSNNASDDEKGRLE